MRRTHLTLLLALAPLLAQTRPALAQAQAPAGGQQQPSAAAQAEKPAAPARSQSPVQLDKQAEEIRRAVRRIGVGRTVSVIIEGGDDLHGSITYIGEAEFDISEVDQRRLVTVRYGDVKKVRRGYAPRPNLFTGQRNSPPVGMRIAAVAGLVALIALPLIILGTAKE